MVSQLLPGGCFSAECEALFACEPGSNAVEVGYSGGIGMQGDLLMVLSSSNNHKIVGQGPGNGLEGSDLLGPRGKHEGEFSHAEGTSLWNTAGVVVRQSLAAC